MDYPNQTLTITSIRYGISDKGYTNATTSPTEPVTANNAGQADTKDLAAITAAISTATAEIGDLTSASKKFVIPAKARAANLSRF